MALYNGPGMIVVMKSKLLLQSSTTELRSPTIRKSSRWHVIDPKLGGVQTNDYRNYSGR